MALWAALSVAGFAAAPQGTGDSWIAKVRRDHPRLFFNRETWPRVRDRALGPEKAWFARVKAGVDRAPAAPSQPREWAPEAAQAAFVFLMTGDRKYLDQARRMLELSVAFYRDCYSKRTAVNWYSTSRVLWLSAYDWIFNDLGPDERRALLVPFLGHVEDTQPGRGKPAVHRLNLSDHTTGFYGEPNIVWFAGLAAHGDGIDDAAALRFLKLGYQHNQDLFAYRAQCAGDDGGLVSATVGYAMGAYPWAQFNFLHTWKSAVGEDLAPKWPHLAYFPVWVLWNWIPGSPPLEFGSGDTYHYDNHLPVGCLYEHMSQIMHFYGKSQPEGAALAAHLREILPRGARTYSGAWPIHPFLLTELEKAPPPRGPQDSGLFARHFEALGQVFMRSGNGPEDTYALFTIGSRVPSHKHHDENSFVIYKKGYLALDTGTRARETDFQLRHYYSQTVAHNGILIHMPGEPFPGYWGPACGDPEGKVSCGGTYRTTGGRCAAFETGPHFTYVAGDATPCYRPEKCALALRQFVFAMPDHFVICDRVVSTRAEYRKEWLLHTQDEPRIEGKEFYADHGEGRLIGRTLWPKDAVLSRIGGPGKEYWACGRNWETLPEIQREWGTKGHLGNWRIEVAPGAPRMEDVFLHLLQVGDRSRLAAMGPAELVEAAGGLGVKFEAGGKTFTVTFSTRGEPAGGIRIVSGGRTLVDRDLSRKVQPQSGLAGK